MNLVQLSTHDLVAVVTLQDPEHRNAISLEMAGEMRQMFDEIEADPDVSAVVITGAGRAFCAGADLATLRLGDPAVYRQLYEAFLRVARCPLPTIAAVNGPATGAGMNLALCCDIRVTAPRARFIARFLELGLHPGGGHTWMLTRAVGLQRAKAMVLCGLELDGEEAVAAGLALACVDADQLLPEALALAQGAASVPRVLLERTKATLDGIGRISRQEDAVDLESEAQAWSASLPYFKDRVDALQRSIAARATDGGTP
jgi:enoyl-CoA hydratase